MTATISRHQKMAERMAILHELLHDPTVPVTTYDILTGRDRDTDRTVGLRLVRPPGPGDPEGPAIEAGAGSTVDPVGIDPRMRARRIAVQRSHGRRRLGRLLLLAGVLGGVALAWVVTRTPLLDVDRVAVVGAGRTAVADVVAATGIAQGEALLDVDLGAAATGVDALPWVASAVAERHWPGTVVVRIEERRPVAVAPYDEGEWAVLSGDGRLMEVVPEPPAGLVPLVDVPPVTVEGELEPDTIAALAVARLLPASLSGRLLGVGMGTDGGVELRLDPVGVVRLGESVDVSAKLVAADAVLGQAPAGCVAVVDVQVPESPVLTRRPECG